MWWPRREAADSGQAGGVPLSCLLTANLNGRLKLEQVGLAHEYLLGCETEHADFVLRKLHLLPWPAIPHVQQPFYYLIDLSDILVDRNGHAG